MSSRVDEEDPVVVVGFSYRFPQDATSDETFWAIIRDGISTMSEVPESRYNVNGHHSSNLSRPDTISARGGHFIKGDISAFDAPFFKMSSAEAKAMDPQLRLLLETTYHAFESAGISLDKATGSNTSVYVGNLVQEYGTMFSHDGEINPKYHATGNAASMLPNRLSWFYDLRGPSMSVDTACSSSLVGLHLACQSLFQGESDMSIVGGVQLQLEPRTMTAALSRLGFLSPDGHSYSFDDRANGYSRGEGVGIVVLKLLSKAIEDGDTIRAVIRGTAVNQDGRTPSISQPSSEAQAALIRKAYEPLGWDYAHTGYFEAHGTGTPLGDVIEAKGISMVFTEHCSEKKPLFVGSVKANIGHLEPSAGIAGLIKVVLMLERGVIPPNAMMKNLNPRILADQWHLKARQFPTSAMTWPTEGLRRASVNSFGVGGTNGHVVVDDALHYLQNRGKLARHNTISRADYCSTNGNDSTNGVGDVNGLSKAVQNSMVFLLSAADEDGIYRQASALQNHLNQPRRVFGNKNLYDMAYTLSAKRSQLPWKTFIRASSAAALQQALSSLPQKPTRTTECPQVNFVFTGQGAQWAAMGKELLGYSSFRHTIEYADSYLKSLGSTWSVFDELYKPPSESRIDEPALSQPLFTLFQIALVDILESWGISPQAVVGHSSGEIAAAYCSGALSRNAALRVAYFRGQAISKLLEDVEAVPGGMLAVGLGEAELSSYIASVIGNDDSIVLSSGCANSPKNTTVTGDEAALVKLEDRLRVDRVFVRRLKVPVAYHSRRMTAVADIYRKALEPSLDCSSGRYAVFYSSVTGVMASTDDISQADYWVSNLVSQVKFSQALQLMCLAQEEQSDFKQPTYLLEVGPHAALERPIRECLGTASTHVYDCAVRRGTDAIETLQHTAGRLAMYGHVVDFRGVNDPDGSAGQPRMLLNLPRYAFNHSNSYWIESRLSKNARTRGTPRHELLGTMCADWNPLKPKWRFIIREADMPWVSDHKINDTVLYPAAGMLVMVFEAIRALTTAKDGISGYRLRDVIIGSALVVPSTDEGVEVQLLMSAHDSASNKNSLAFDFSIFSAAGDEWRLHCSGQVFAQESSGTDIVSEQQQRMPKLDGEENSIKTSYKSCSADIDATQFYQDMYRAGAHFGENFRTLHDIRYDYQGKHAVGSLPFRDWKARALRGESTEHLIHPSTLDGLIHVLFASIYDDIVSTSQTMVPVQFSEVYVSRGLLLEDGNDAMRVHGRITSRALANIEGNATATSTRTGEPLISFKGLRLTGLQSTKGRQDTLDSPTSLFHRMQWRPDITMMSQDQIEDYCRQHTKSILNADFDLAQEVISRYFMAKSLQSLAPAILLPTNDSSQSHLSKYARWIKDFVESEKDSTAALETCWSASFGDQRGTISSLVEGRIQQGLVNQLIVSYGRKLPSILAGELNPLEILFNDGLADLIYQSPRFSLSANRLATYVDLWTHKNSDVRIIEVGAGTGSTTTPILEALTRHGRFAGASARMSRYDFTDISPSFLASAQERYAAHSHLMRFRTLDIERDPEEQGFEPESYDLVVAAAVLHATSNIQAALANVKKLLKRGGQLVLLEPTNLKQATIPFAFGALPGWWLSNEKSRSSGPLLTRLQWEHALQQAGFAAPQLSLADDIEETHTFSVLASRAGHGPLPWEKSEPILESASTVIVTELQEQAELGALLKTKLATTQSAGTVCDIVSVASLANGMPSKYDRCICLVELGQPILSHLTEVQFQALHNILEVSKKIIWVTDDCGEQARNPEAAMFTGFAKTLVRERPQLNMVHLNVTTRNKVAETIMRIVQRSSCDPKHASDQETDILEENGLIFVPRVVEAPDINSLFDSDRCGLKPEPVEVGKGDEANEDDDLELRFTPGRLDSLHFRHCETSAAPLQDDEVRVLVKAVGINFKDVMVTLNQVSDDHIGQEFAGVIMEVGGSSSSDKTAFQPGDRVCGIAGGTFRSRITAKKTHLMKMPASLSFAQASAIPIIYATAQYGLHHLARIKPGESILIHAAAGGVGQAAVQLAQEAGAIVYVTVSTPEKKKLLVDRYGVDPANVFSSRHLFFAQQIMERMGDKAGVDVVLNSLAGQALAESWRCLAPFGRFIDIGKRDMSTFKSLPMEPFLRNVSFCSLDLALVSKLDGNLMASLMHEVQGLIVRRAASREKIDLVYPLTVLNRSGIEEAFRLLQTGRQSGKIVIDWEKQDTIQVVPRSPLDYKFDCNATYIIAGGLGGIGRSTAAWMHDNGAKHLVLLSRSGPKSDAAKVLVSTLRDAGVDVYCPRCDIADLKSLETVIAHVRMSMPPIKGCIQATMVVENQIFENYSLAAFQMSIDSKVRGSYNLHHLLPMGMDFFVLLSSLAGVSGAGSQSNYAAASSFLDAFARTCYSQGRRCLSLDLGIVQSIGYIAERVDVMQNLAMAYLDVKQLRESDVYFMLKYACMPPSPSFQITSAWQTQIMGALTTPAHVKRGGMLQDLGWMRAPVFRHLYRMELGAGRKDPRGAGSSTEQADTPKAQLRTAVSLTEAAAIVTEGLAKRLARSLAMPVEDIDVNKPPYAFGVDSLVAVELLFWFSQEICAEVPVVQILSSSTIAQLGLAAAKKSDFMKALEIGGKKVE